MLHLHFRGITEGYSFVCSPCGEYRIERGVMRNAEGQVIAEHHGGGWRSGEAMYTRIECSGPVCFHFEQSSQPVFKVLGPFDSILIRGPVLVVNGTDLCTIGDDGSWRIVGSAVSWPVLVLRSA